MAHLTVSPLEFVQRAPFPGGAGWLLHRRLADGRHRRHLPVARHPKVHRHSGTIKRSELTDRQTKRLGLHRQVSDRLSQVVERELGVLPVGSLHPAVAQIREEDAGLRRPASGAACKVGHEALMHGVASATDDERPRLGVARRESPTGSPQECLHLGDAGLVRWIERCGTPPPRQQGMQHSLPDGEAVCGHVGPPVAKRISVGYGDPASDL